MKKFKIIFYIIIISVLVLGFLSYYHYKQSTRNAVLKLVQQNKLINILVTGSNKKDLSTQTHRFYMIASINPENNSIGLIFLPPSLQIAQDNEEVPFVRLDKISFYEFSTIQKSIYNDIKLNVPFYIQLYPHDVERIVDLVGGIDIFILDQVQDMSYLQFGENYLDGKKTMNYINSVEQDSIYLKYDRIQDVIITLFNDKHYIKQHNSVDYLNVLFEGKNIVSTNLKIRELYAIGQLCEEATNIITTIMPGKFVDDRYIIDDISYKIFEKEFLKIHIVDPEKVPQEKIKILNGTNISGLARKLKAKLKKEGYNVIEFATSPYPKMKHSIIINRIGNNNKTVRKIAKFTGIKRTYNIIDNTELNNILIIIGEDFSFDRTGKN